MRQSSTERYHQILDWRQNNPEKIKEYNRRTYDKRFKERREWFNSLKENIPCKDCGEILAPCVMEWHHKDKSSKEFTISRNIYGGNKERILKEIAKCELLCSNCHRLRHNEI